ncbi:MAG: hypothetical protein UY91_C0033G0007 [Parcubacteria group bacterium GW2011_GWB1_55_9]|nr:MAG: hypothetical protein UY91_C0033G0007 [Parcubacteria group bacterium GW2011_GWB1_55_9]
MSKNPFVNALVASGYIGLTELVEMNGKKVSRFKKVD